MRPQSESSLKWKKLTRYTMKINTVVYNYKPLQNPQNNVFSLMK